MGSWRTIDDVTGRTKSIVTISEEGGKLAGTIRKVYDPYPKETLPLLFFPREAGQDLPNMRFQIDESRYCS